MPINNFHYFCLRQKGNSQERNEELGFTLHHVHYWWNTFPAISDLYDNFTLSMSQFPSSKFQTLVFPKSLSCHRRRRRDRPPAITGNLRSVFFFFFFSFASMLCKNRIFVQNLVIFYESFVLTSPCYCKIPIFVQNLVINFQFFLCAYLALSWMNLSSNIWVYD